MAATLAACSSTPGGVIPPERMARLMADIHTGESVVDQHSSAYRTDSAKAVLRQSICAAHGYTVAELDSSLRWYGYHTEDYVKLYDRVIVILEDEIAQAQADAGSKARGQASSSAFGFSTASQGMDGDSVNVWSDVTSQRFSTISSAETMPFELKADRFWERGDIYTLSWRTTSAPGTSELTIVAEYQDGTRDYATAASTGDGWKRVRLVLDPTRAAHAVYGTLTYRPKGFEVAFADSISLLRERTDDITTHHPAPGQLRQSSTYAR